jgi:hypothetical protein
MSNIIEISYVELARPSAFLVFGLMTRSNVMACGPLLAELC